jgi:hypothetical protein
LYKGAQTAFGVPHNLDIFDLRMILEMFGQQAGQFLLIDVARQAVGIA